MAWLSSCFHTCTLLMRGAFKGECFNVKSTLHSEWTSSSPELSFIQPSEISALTANPCGYTVKSKPKT